MSRLLLHPTEEGSVRSMLLSLKRREGDGEEAQGEAWMVHLSLRQVGDREIDRAGRVSKADGKWIRGMANFCRCLLSCCACDCVGCLTYALLLSWCVWLCLIRRVRCTKLSRRRRLPSVNSRGTCSHRPSTPTHRSSDDSTWQEDIDISLVG